MSMPNGILACQNAPAIWSVRYNFLSARIFVVGSHVGRLLFSTFFYNWVWLHLTLKSRRNILGVTSQKGDLVEHSFGLGKKAVLSHYTSKCPVNWCLFYSSCWVVWLCWVTRQHPSCHHHINLILGLTLLYFPSIQVLFCSSDPHCTLVSSMLKWFKVIIHT